MALNKKTRTVSASTPAVQAEPAQSTPTPSSDFTALQTALSAIVELVTKLDGKVAELDGKVAELAGELDKSNERLAAIEAAMEEDGDDDEDEDDEEEADSDEDEEEDDEDGDEVTADDIDCNKVYKHFSSVSAEDQKAILVKAVKDSGIKNINARSLRKDANAALAVAEVMCDDKYGWEAEDFLKDE